MSVGEVSNREERPAYVRFERRPVEDKEASIREGRYMAKDVDFALITPPYSKDCVEQKVTRWLEDLERGVRDGRIPQQWATLWKEGYQKWQNGQEMPLHGTPILGWGVISPAQAENAHRHQLHDRGRPRADQRRGHEARRYGRFGTPQQGEELACIRQRSRRLDHPDVCTGAGKRATQGFG